jgi:hypothetical protein
MTFPLNPVVGSVVSHAAGDIVVRVLEFCFQTAESDDWESE